MKESHQFTDKIVSDIDNSLIKNNQWVFPTENFRFFNKDGKGFIASILDGNEYEFSVTDGFCIVGVNVYNSIAYIASYNEQSGIGELGSYPSPQRDNTRPTGFVREYSPLMNLDLGHPSLDPMRTSKLNFDLSFPVDILLKLSDDDSVDLYMCDYNMPNKVINSGFDQTGRLTTIRTYTESMFDGAIYQFPISNNIPLITVPKVSTGGNLKPGNYYIYLRYINIDLIGTNFVKEIGPFFVAEGNNTIDFAGKQDKDWILNRQNYTNKKITFNVANIDTNFKYIQIGVIRNTSLQENGSSQQETWLINNYFPIINTSCSVIITGRETQMLLSFEDITLPVNEYNICRSQIQVFNLWLGATWKKKVVRYDKNKLKAFAQKVSLSERARTDIFNYKMYDIDDYENGNAVDLQCYQDSDNVFSSIGYFKGQIYPFGVKFNFTDGTSSEVFPAQGQHDPGTIGYSVLRDGTEYKGLFRFSDWLDLINAQTDYNYTQKIITSIVFDITTAMNFIYADPDFADVASITFMRGERIDNFICQGMLMRGMYGVDVVLAGPDGFNGPMSFGTDQVIYVNGEGGQSDYTGWDPQNCAIMPLLNGTLPFSMLYNNSGSEQSVYGEATPNQNTTMCEPHNISTDMRPNLDRFCLIDGGDVKGDPWECKHGLFSPDVLFRNNLEVPTDSYLEFVCIYRDLELCYKRRDDLLPSIYALDLSEDITWCEFEHTMFMNTKHHTSSVIVEKGQYKGRMNMSSKFGGDNHRAFSINEGAVQSRDISTCRYIGIEDLGKGRMNSLYGDHQFNQHHMGASIVNLYKTLNDAGFFTQTRSAFNVTTTNYFPISDDISLKSVPVNNTVPHYTNRTYELFKGDCFLQKTWMRVQRWNNISGNPGHNPNHISKPGFGNEFLDGDGKYYQHGFLLGIVTENVVNTQARNNVIGQDTSLNFLEYTFYPKALSYGITTLQYAVLEASQYLAKALQVNSGYNKVSSDKIITGYNTVEIFNITKKPNRVYISDKNNYRLVRINSFQDYCVEDGPITAIRIILDLPYLVQEFGINQFFVAERMLGQTENNVDVIMGNSLTLLGDSTRKIMSIGSQHKSSMISSNVGDLGVDFAQRSIWMVFTNQTATGKSMIQGKILSTELLIENELKQYLDTYNVNSDIMSIPKDDPLHGSGIVSGYDPEFKEIWISFLLCNDPTGFYRIDKTYIFDIRVMGFKGTYGFAKPLYFNIGNKVFSVGSTNNPMKGLYEYRPDKNVWKFNTGVKKQTFFGIKGTAKLSFIINGLSEKEESNTSKIQKIITSIGIECKDYELTRVLYETLYQNAIFAFDLNNPEICLRPTYENHQWIVPAQIQTSNDLSQYNKYSEMQGKWCKVTIEYDGDLDLEIRGVECEYDIKF